MVGMGASSEPWTFRISSLGGVRKACLRTGFSSYRWAWLVLFPPTPMSSRPSWPQPGLRQRLVEETKTLRASAQAAQRLAGKERHRRNLQRTVQSSVARTLAGKQSGVASRCAIGADARLRQSARGTGAHFLPVFSRFAKRARKAATACHLVWQVQAPQPMLSAGRALPAQHGQSPAGMLPEESPI